MKRKFLILAVVLCVVMLLPMTVNADMIIDAAYSHPTIDGEINEEEWGSPSMIMDADTCTDQPWGNGISASAKVYFAWSEGGLYMAAQVTDSLLKLTDNLSNVFFASDAFQLAVNPGQLIGPDAAGVFFSIGMTDGGEVGVMRHNYADADGVGAAAEGQAIKRYVGQGKKTEDGWQFELYLPWDQIHVSGVSGADKLTPKAGLEEGVMLCYLDRPLERHFKSGMGAFNTGDFGSVLTLLAKEADSYGTADPEIKAPAPVTEAPETDPVTEPTTEPATEAPVTETEPVTEGATEKTDVVINKGDTAKEGIPAWIWIVVAVAAVAVIAVVVVVASKKKK